MKIVMRILPSSKDYQRKPVPPLVPGHSAGMVLVTRYGIGNDREFDMISTSRPRNIITLLTIESIHGVSRRISA